MYTPPLINSIRQIEWSARTQPPFNMGFTDHRPIPSYHYIFLGSSSARANARLLHGFVQPFGWRLHIEIFIFALHNVYTYIYARTVPKTHLI